MKVLPKMMLSVSWPFTIMSDTQVAYVSPFISCPNSSSRASGLRLRR